MGTRFVKGLALRPDRAAGEGLSKACESSPQLSWMEYDRVNGAKAAPKTMDQGRRRCGAFSRWWFSWQSGADWPLRPRHKIAQEPTLRLRSSPSHFGQSRSRRAGSSVRSPGAALAKMARA